MRVAIVADTNSGINEKEATKLGIHIIPMPVVINGTIFFEGVNLTEEELYKALKEGQDVSTSQPSPADIIDKWDELLKEYDQIVYIPMSSGLSGSCMTASGLAQDYEDRVFVVDNHRISVTMRSSVMDARKMAAEGMDAASIKEKLEKTAFDATIYLAVDSLEYLKKGGRISSAAAAIGGMLKIKPVLTIQGEKIEPWAKVRGAMKRCEEKMLDATYNDWKKRFPEYSANQLRVGVAGAGLDQESIDEWIALAKEKYPESEVYYDPLSASIGTHTGPGAVGIGVSFVRNK